LKGTSCIRLKAGAKLEDYHDGAFGSTAGRANRGRIFAWLRDEFLVWHRRTQNTPAEIVEKLNKEVNAALADPKMKARLADLGGIAIAGSPADFGKLIADETEKWGKVVRAANIKAD
jgi:Tripartite tricarboxylate transporter family receptor